MGYMVVISGVLALFSWNAGNRALTPIDGVLFINVVPVTTFVISIRSGYNMGHWKSSARRSRSCPWC
jgi:hypothetical protein